MIHSVLTTMVQVIVPLSIPAIAGAVLVRLKGLETKNLLTLVLYFLLPCMVFDTIFNAQLVLIFSLRTDKNIYLL
ncbi:MAG TPA: hypothetical protein VN381_06205, partial [Anaerovoracaceae bacterium]|nr:hypothetical protein [Anaerovoracaceae bacterium]